MVQGVSETLEAALAHQLEAALEGQEASEASPTGGGAILVSPAMGTDVPPAIHEPTSTNGIQNNGIVLCILSTHGM